MWGLPKIHAKLPAALLAVGGATAATHGMGLDVQLLGSLPSGLDAFKFGIPMMDMPSLGSMPSLAATIFLIYAMTSAESLLSCAALAKMKKTSYKHHPDQELIGQGLANVGAGMFMGMPVTSVIARSCLNVRMNAETRLPALVQAGFVFSSVVFFSDSISNIPMPALSGMLITTGLSMLNPVEFKHCYAVQKLDTLPFITTIAGIVAFGLAEGIGIGCASAVAMQYATATSLVGAGGSSSMTKLQVVAPATTSTASEAVWTLKGPINFMSMFEIDGMMQDLKESASSRYGADNATKPIVVDVGAVTTLEFTGVEELVNRLLEQGHTWNVPVHLLNVSPTMDQALDQCDVQREIIRFPAAAATSI
jgi:SulP family sulfate permease